MRLEGGSDAGHSRLLDRRQAQLWTDIEVTATGRDQGPATSSESCPPYHQERHALEASRGADPHATVLIAYAPHASAALTGRFAEDARSVSSGHAVHATPGSPCDALDAGRAPGDV